MSNILQNYIVSKSCDRLVEPEVLGGLCACEDGEDLLHVAGPAVVVGQRRAVEGVEVVADVLLEAGGEARLALALVEGQQALQLVGVRGAHAVLGQALQLVAALVDAGEQVLLQVGVVHALVDGLEHVVVEDLQVVSDQAQGLEDAGEVADGAVQLSQGLGQGGGVAEEQAGLEGGK